MLPKLLTTWGKAKSACQIWNDHELQNQFFLFNHHSLIPLQGSGADGLRAPGPDRENLVPSRPRLWHLPPPLCPPPLWVTSLSLLCFYNSPLPNLFFFFSSDNNRSGNLLQPPRADNHTHTHTHVVKYANLCFLSVSFICLSAGKRPSHH